MTKYLIDIIKDWKKEAGVRPLDETTLFHVCKNTIYIITSKPGLFIGYHGKLVDKYRQLIKDNGYDENIEFVDSFPTQDVKQF